MPKKVQATKEGKTWSMRRRVLGQDFYVSGKRTKTEAEQEMKDLVDAQAALGKPKGFGPLDTTVAQALQDMALERLKFLKGAVKDADRINRWLRAAGLATLKVTPWAQSEAARKSYEELGVAPEDQGVLFCVTLEPPAQTRRIPRGLVSHRRSLVKASSRSDKVRAYVGGLPMAAVQTDHLQGFIDALRGEGKKPATVQLERAVLRGLFNHARKRWHWGLPKTNPALGLDMPVVDNGRTRVMSLDEQSRLDDAIADCRNRLVGPTMTLFTETGMRASEPIEHARWRDVDWDKKVLSLQDAKTGRRGVPLSPKAIAALHELRSLTGGRPDDKVVAISYESLKAAWKRACERAGVDDLRIQDLRHTAATRLALKSGNVFLVKALTGHKTMAMLERYVNVGAEDVANFLNDKKGAFLYFVAAPLAERRPPIRFPHGATESGSASGATVIRSFRQGFGQLIDVDPQHELLIRSDFLQSSAATGRAQTQWLLNARYPLASLASGMYGLTRIRGQSTESVSVSSSSDALSEIATFDLPNGEAVILQPHHLVGVLQRRDMPMKVSSHWRLGTLHAWLTFQFRYLMFHGPATILVKGCRGVRVQEPDRGRSVNQAATIGFSSGLSYRTSRTETFVAYLSGQKTLLNDRFDGVGYCLYQEMPQAAGRAGVTGRGLEGILDGCLKAFGI